MFQDLFAVSLVYPLISNHARELGASPTIAGLLGWRHTLMSNDFIICFYLDLFALGILGINIIYKRFNRKFVGSVYGGIQLFANPAMVNIWK